VALKFAASFDAGSGSTVIDDSGGGHPLTVVSGSYTGSGHSGAGFANTSDTATTGASGTVPAVTGTTCTVMAWVKPSSLASGSSHLVCGALGSDASTYFAIYTQRGDFSTHNVLQGNARISGGVVAVNGAALTVGTWTHLALTFDGTTLKLFKDGTLASSVANTGTLSNGTTFYIAGHDAEGTAAVTVDDVRYFDSDESANITTWMNTSVTGSGGSTINVSASLTEAATLAATSSRVAFGSSALSEVSSVDATATRSTFGTAALTEAATLTGSANQGTIVSASGSLSEASSLAASTSRSTFATGSLSETSSSSASPTLRALPTAALIESATFTAIAHNSTVSVSLDMSENFGLSAEATTNANVSATPGNPYIPPTPNNPYARNDWRAWVFDTATGAFETDLPLANIPSYNYGINDQGGSGSVDVAIVGPDAFDPLLLSQYAENEGWRWSVGVSHNDVILQAGPILTETYTDPSTYVTLAFAGIWKVFTKRVVLNPAVPYSTPLDPMADLTYTNVTPRQLAKLLIQDNMTSQGDLPIDLPDDDTAAGTLTQTYYGYDLNVLADALGNLTTMDGGPELEFRPYWSDPLTVRWAMRSGSPHIGTIGAPWAYDYGERGAMVLLDKASDSTATAFGFYARGSGNQDTSIIGYGADMTLPSQGFPMLLAVDGNHNNETSVSNLNAFATADVQTYKAPVRTYSATIRLNGTDKSGLPTGSPNLSQLQMGDTLTAHVEGHARIATGTYTWRVLNVANNDEQTCKIALQPTS
jgi:hypothetical protein